MANAKSAGLRESHPSDRIPVQREQLLAAVVDHAPFPIGVYLGKEMRIELANPSMLAAWGKGNDVIGKSYLEVLPELDNQDIFQQLDQVLTTGVSFHATNRRVDIVVDGQLKPFYFNYSFTPLFDDRGQVYGVMNTAADVTNLNLAQYLQDITNKFETALVSLIPVEEDGKITDFLFKMANTAYSKYSGLSPEAIQNRKVSEIFPDYRQTIAFEKYVETFQTGSTTSWDIHYHLDGLNVHFSVVASMMNDELIVHLTDFTTLKTLEEELLRKIKELERSNQNLEEFAHASSHDLKEPIRKIHFFTDRLKTQLGQRLDESDIRIFERIEIAILRMSSLIEDLLLYSHVSLQPHEKDIVDLNLSVRNVLDDLEVNILEKRATIILHPLPVIKGFRRQLQQLFQNLISNALKYSRPQSSPTIEIRCEEISAQAAALVGIHNPNNGGYHLVSLKDNGIGFEQHHSDRIFLMFQRLHGRDEYGGTGVGLSIAKKIVENHEGWIRAVSEPGKGTTFLVYLPMTP